MNWIDKLIAPFAPKSALARVQARRVLDAMNAYEAAKPSRTRKNRSDNRSPATVTDVTATIRGQARHLEHNHDLANGILDTLVKRTIGPNGIGVEPQPRNKDGKINSEVAKRISFLRKRWEKCPDVTGEVSNAMMEQLLARAWFRDGEAFSKDVMGSAPGLIHGTKVPYSLELLEADWCPVELNDLTKGIRQGIQRNAWGRPVYYYFSKQQPGDAYHWRGDTRSVNADVIHHIKMVTRLNQARGVSVFASILNRLNDIKDYEESERVAARIAAAFAFYIRKGQPEMFNAEDDDSEERDFGIEPGAVFDDLMPGEDVGTIQSNRPSPLLQPFRDAMLKACSSGSKAAYSSISKNYDGSFSAMRMEMIDSWDDYAILSAWFIHQHTCPSYERFVQMAFVSGELKLPDELDKETLFDADFIGPTMPWIDPQKQAKGEETQLGNGTVSPQKLIRKAGGNPQEVLDQLEQWKEELRGRGLLYLLKESDAVTQPEPEEKDDE